LQAHLPLQIRNKARLDGSWQACIPSQTCAIRRSLSFGRYQLNPSRLVAGTRMPACHSTRAPGSHHALLGMRSSRTALCVRSEPAASPTRMLRTSFSEASSFQIHVACRKTLYGHQTSSLFLLRLPQIGLASRREPRCGSLNSVATLQFVSPRSFQGLHTSGGKHRLQKDFLGNISTAC
jgi:hypothetical protein